MDLDVEFTFCCAHRLPRYQGVCSRPHGHQYRLAVTVTGKVDPISGMITDFEDLRRVVWDEALGLVDHRDLNESLENPTAENLVVFLWEKLAGKVAGLRQLRLWETPEYSVTYRGEPQG